MASDDNGNQVYRLPFPVRVSVVAVSLIVAILIAESWEMALVIVLFYAYGSVPYAALFSRALVGNKIEEEGSGNVGVANTYMNAGMLAGSLTVAGEISKGLIPLLVSYLYFDYQLLASVLFVAAALLGTNFSLFNKLIGGMGTTIVLWSLLVMSPIGLLGVVAVIFLSYLIVKDTYWMTVIAYAAGPLLILVLDGRTPLVGFAIFVAAIYLLKFRRSMDEFERSKGLKARAP